MRATIALLLTVLWLHHPSLAWAQLSPALVVTLRDAAGRGVPGVTVLVRDSSGQRLLADGQTDSDGSVTVEDVPAAEVRVAVRGDVHGVPLSQPVDDALGLLVFLDTSRAVVELRVEDGGLVVPDPSMFALERAPAPAAALPTAPLAATSAVLTSTPAATGAVGETTTGAIEAASPSASGSGGSLLGLLLILGLVAALLAVLAHERRAA